jgi:hypothetical protein
MPRFNKSLILSSIGVFSTLVFSDLLSAAPKITPSQEILELRSGFETQVELPKKKKNRISLHFNAVLPMQTRLTSTRGIPFSQVQGQSIAIDYSLELIQNLETRVGLGFEYFKATAFETVGSNTEVDSFSIKKLPLFNISSAYLFANDPLFAFGTGASVSFANQSYNFSSTNTSAVAVKGSSFSPSGKLFLEAQFRRWGEWTGLIQTGWSIAKLPNRTLDNGLDTATVNSWDSGLFLSIGLGRRF